MAATTTFSTGVSAGIQPQWQFRAGTGKTVTMHWKIETLQSITRISGITLKSSFDVKPGSYLVRLVVRDSEDDYVGGKRNDRNSFSATLTPLLIRNSSNRLMEVRYGLPTVRCSLCCCSALRLGLLVLP